MSQERMQPPSIFTTCFLKCCPRPGWKTVHLSSAVPGVIGEANFPDVLLTSFLLLFPLIKTCWYEDCRGVILHPDSGSVTLVHCQRQLRKVTQLVCIAFHLPGSKCNCFVFHGLKMTRYQPLTPCRANQDAAESVQNCYVGIESRSVITECVWTQQGFWRCQCSFPGGKQTVSLGHSNSPFIFPPLP